MGRRAMPAKKIPAISTPIFSVILDRGSRIRGVAKHRLPLAHVISTLRELDFMIRDLGKKIQRESGMSRPDGDFGIELLATEHGLAFRRGSVETQAVITRDVQNGIRTIAQIIGTTNAVQAKKAVASVDEYGMPIIQRLAKIIPFQEKDKTEMKLALEVPGRAIEQSRFGKVGIQTVKRLTSMEFAIESLTLYGKLKNLTDRSQTDEEDDIWGELLEDNGDTWRMKFEPGDLKKVKSLFTKQVMVTGDASYYPAYSPRLDVKEIKEDKPRNYVAAFNAFGRKYKDVLGDRTPGEILASIRG